MNKYDDTDYQIEREESIEYEEKKENIEKDIKTLNEVLIHYRETEEVRKVIKNILDERKADKKRIKELESKLEKANKQLDLDYVDKNYIPVQKVKDKIEELKKAKRETTRENWHYIYTIQLKILEEILEEK